MNERESTLGWWVIHGDDLIEMLQRAHAGEDPGIIYAEVYANSKLEEPDE